MPDTDHDAHPNVRSSRYFIVESRTQCDRCNVVTAVFGLALPAGYESLYVNDDTPDDVIETWEAPGMAAVLSYVDFVPESVANRIRSLTQHYRLDAHSEADGAFWMNHCEHCGVRLEEEELHGDPGCPFVPVSDEGLEAIQLHEVREPFAACAGAESHDVTPLDS
jgi:hypothetical protein